MTSPLDTAARPVLECAGLVKRFGDRTAVDGAGFHIRSGEAYGLLGPNGAGKTTTISMLCGLLRPDAGEITVAGRRMDTGDPQVKSAIGYVPQEIALYPDLTARENLRFFGRLYGLSGRDLGSRIDETLDLVGLADRGDDRVSTYSGGMQRRLNIAAGLLHRPKLLVLDEPTVGVDPQSRNAILERVGELRAEGLGVLYTTHYMEEAQRLCDRIGIIDSGRILAEGTTAELVASLGHSDRVDVKASGPVEKLALDCRGIDGVDEATVVDGGLQLLAHGGRRVLPRLLEAAERRGVA
ncbi:MAG TPA: ABC transporter ATP-binding protein, partial [Actinomycetota bacterium]|nr:ABC transporter ATP-binding protein [Actinomycetota bacterium]